MRNRLVATAAALIATCGLAQAEMTTFAKEGFWSAFGGKDGAKPVCGVDASGDGHYFAIKRFASDDFLTVQLTHDTWKLADGRVLNIKMHFDDFTPWVASAKVYKTEKGGTGVTFTVPYKDVDRWSSDFARAHDLDLEFVKEKDVDDWDVSLKGTMATIGQFKKCLAVMPK